MLFFDNYLEIESQSGIPNAIRPKSYYLRIVVVTEEWWISLIVYGLDVDNWLVVSFFII